MIQLSVVTINCFASDSGKNGSDNCMALSERLSDEFRREAESGTTNQAEYWSMGLDISSMIIVLNANKGITMTIIGIH